MYCHITVAIMENDSTEVGMSLYYHGNRQTVLITDSLKVSFKYWKNFLVFLLMQTYFSGFWLASFLLAQLGAN